MRARDEYVEEVSHIQRQRSRIEIMATILGFALPGVRKTYLLYNSNLNFHRFNGYLEVLIENGLITEIYKGQIKLYQTTDKGKKFLSNYELLSKLMDFNKTPTI